MLRLALLHVIQFISSTFWWKKIAKKCWCSKSVGNDGGFLVSEKITWDFFECFWRLNAAFEKLLKILKIQQLLKKSKFLFWLLNSHQPTYSIKPLLIYHLFSCLVSWLCSVDGFTGLPLPYWVNTITDVYPTVYSWHRPQGTPLNTAFCQG